MPMLVTIAEIDDELKAHFVRSMLENEGIRCFLINEYLTKLGRNYEPVGGVRLQVPQGDAESALRLLASEGERLGVRIPAEVKKPEFCPRCGGREVEYRKLYALFSQVLFLPFWGKRYRCGQCGHGWK